MSGGAVLVDGASREQASNGSSNSARTRRMVANEGTGSTD
jgi:hypothetical protein